MRIFGLLTEKLNIINIEEIEILQYERSLHRISTSSRFALIKIILVVLAYQKLRSKIKDISNLVLNPENQAAALPSVATHLQAERPHRVKINDLPYFETIWADCIEWGRVNDFIRGTCVLVC